MLLQSRPFRRLRFSEAERDSPSKLTSIAQELSTNMPTPRMILLFCLIAAAAMSRLLPHPENMTPITAMALFAAAYLPSRRLSLGLPLAAMFVGDVILYATRDAAYQSVMIPMTACVYLAFAVIGLLGRWLQTTKSPARVVGMATLGSVLFFLLTNFGVWAVFTESYPRTVSGLVDCYILGLPFFRNALLGDLGYTAILFGGFALLERTVPQMRTANAS